MVSTKMSPERPDLGTMSTTSAFLTAGSPAAQPAHDLHAAAGAHAARHRDRRQHDALVGVPVGPDLALHARSRRRYSANQCGGSSTPFLMLSGSMSKVPAARRMAISPTSSSVVADAADPAASASTIASSIQLMRVPSLRRGDLHGRLRKKRRLTVVRLRFILLLESRCGRNKSGP